MTKSQQIKLMKDDFFMSKIQKVLDIGRISASGWAYVILLHSMCKLRKVCKVHKSSSWELLFLLENYCFCWELKTYALITVKLLFYF